LADYALLPSPAPVTIPASPVSPCYVAPRENARLHQICAIPGRRLQGLRLRLVGHADCRGFGSQPGWRRGTGHGRCRSPAHVSARQRTSAQLSACMSQHVDLYTNIRLRYARVRLTFPAGSGSRIGGSPGARRARAGFRGAPTPAGDCRSGENAALANRAHQGPRAGWRSVFDPGLWRQGLVAATAGEPAPGRRGEALDRLASPPASPAPVPARARNGSAPPPLPATAAATDARANRLPVSEPRQPGKPEPTTTRQDKAATGKDIAKPPTRREGARRDHGRWV